MWFNVQWKKLAILLTPTFLRSELMIAWLELLMESINDIHYQWLQFRKSNIYILAHNSQVCFLRGALNDRFDNEQRRIQIIDGNNLSRTQICFIQYWIISKPSSQTFFPFAPFQQSFRLVETKNVSSPRFGIGIIGKACNNARTFVDIF